jgi:hypothetical protein
MQNFFLRVRFNWAAAFAHIQFKKHFIISLLVLVFLLSLLPIFYPYIEGRDGIVLNDWLQNYMQPADYSIPIFTIVWGAGIWGAYRALLNPRIALKFFVAYCCFLITRSLCLVIVPLNPPIGLVELKDPLTNVFYGGKFMTKDLFYSGHTSAIIIISEILYFKLEKQILLFLAGVLGVLLLFQHVHYTIDIVAAVVFSYFCCAISNKILKKSLSFASR